MAGRRFRDAKNTVDTNANLLSKSQGCFPLTGREWREWREYRNGKLLGFEKFKRRCCKKKKARSSSRAFVEVETGNLAVEIKKNNIAIF